LIIDFQDTVENVGDVFLGHSVVTHNKKHKHTEPKHNLRKNAIFNSQNRNKCHDIYVNGLDAVSKRWL